MFLDQVTILCKAGDGGNGIVAFRREFKVAKGGPFGGDGGHGGSIIVEAHNNVDSLSALAGHKHWKAERGANGEGALRRGRDGEDVIIRVPLGTIVRDVERGHILRDLKEEGERVVVAEGGKGGHGNAYFKSATNRSPREAEPGFPGEERHVSLELKLIADVGLIGKPNAGKSTLLSRLSRARPEIADYPFTTRYPNLGIVQVDYDRQFLMADIPGLIEGAHAGAGLGHEFLKHVERTRVLIHLVEPQPQDQSDPLENYRKIREELKLHDSELAKRPEILVLTKFELPGSEEIASKLEQESGSPVLRISAVTGKGLPELIRRTSQLLDEVRAAESEEPLPVSDSASPAD